MKIKYFVISVSILLTIAFCFFIYFRDIPNVEMSKKVYGQLIKVCELKGSLLTLEEFNSTFPELKTEPHDK